MAHVFIFHGREGHPQANWFPWLKKELEREDHMVFVPQFPVGEKQTLENWLEFFKKYESYITENAIFVGHSLGAVFILTLLEIYSIQSVFLVSGFTGKISTTYYDSLKTFAGKDFDWEKITEHCKKIQIFHGSDDSVVPVEKSEELKKNTAGDLKIIEGGGHLDEAAGYYQFDLLFKKIKESV